MAQHLLGFSWMASDCVSCLVFRPLSFKYPASSEKVQHTAVKVCLWCRLNMLNVCVLVCVSLSAAEMLPKPPTDNSKWCAMAYILISQLSISVLSFPLSCCLTETLSFLTIWVKRGSLPPHAERKFRICHHCLWFCPPQPYFIFKACVKNIFHVSHCQIKQQQKPTYHTTNQDMTV